MPLDMKYCAAVSLTYAWTITHLLNSSIDIGPSLYIDKYIYIDISIYTCTFILICDTITKSSYYGFSEINK